MKIRFIEPGNHPYKPTILNYFADCLQPQGLYPAAHGRGRTQPVAADRFARTGGCAAGAGVPIQ